MTKEIKIKKVRKPKYPIQLCLTASHEGKPCRWLIKKKRYICESGEIACPLMRSKRYCRVYGYKLLNKIEIDEIKELQQQKTYTIWTGRAFEVRAREIRTRFKGKYQETIEEELWLLKRRKEILEELYSNQIQFKNCLLRRCEYEGRLNAVRFYDSKNQGFKKETEQTSKLIERKQAKIKKALKGMTKLEGEIKDGN